jgi:CxxC motif-containing protein (DUF1111 family)
LIKKAHILFIILGTVVLVACGSDMLHPEQNEAYSGGMTGTTFDESFNAFGNQVAGLSNTELDDFAVGNSFFRNNWVLAPSSTVARDGLGPYYNAASCGGCHTMDGRGEPPTGIGGFNGGMLFRLSVSGQDAHGGPMPHPDYGGQLNDDAIPGVPVEGAISVTYAEVTGIYPDGTNYSLRSPSYTIQNPQYGSLSGVMISPRVAQQIPGLGLLESVDEATILLWVDETDANADGISGRANYVWDYTNNTTALGRFGWKANQPSLAQQTAGAFQGDMGITSSYFTDENYTSAQAAYAASAPNGGSPEISMSNLNKVIFYVRALAVPARRHVDDQDVLNGKNLFMQIGCNKCHREIMNTGSNPVLNMFGNQTIRPYTDLLLHDMGDDLSDNRPDYLATGNEWRTPPLWGVGMIKGVNHHTYLLHDGRARNFEEAILWHGGEAQDVKNQFMHLNSLERGHIIKFLESL